MTGDGLSSTRGAAIRVLIVDDHAPFRSVARLIVEAAGYEVAGEAGDGVEALAAAEALTPDVVLLDVELPDTTGLALSDRLAAMPDAPSVVLVSGRRATDFGTGVERAAAAGFIPKEQLSAESLAEVLG